MSTKDERLKEIGSKFQRDMNKLGLGVTISTPGMAAVQITGYCEKPDHGTWPGSGDCPKCTAESV